MRERGLKRWEERTEGYKKQGIGVGVGQYSLHMNTLLHMCEIVHAGHSLCRQQIDNYKNKIDAE